MHNEHLFSPTAQLVLPMDQCPDELNLVNGKRNQLKYAAMICPATSDKEL